MNRLNVNFCGVDFKNPIVPASGTYGYGREYECLYPLSTLGTAARAIPRRVWQKHPQEC